MRKITKAYLVFILCVCFSCADQKVVNKLGADMDENLYELPKICDFTKVRNNSTFEYDCSPQLKDKFFSEFRGLLINGPELIVWPENTNLGDMIVTPKGDTQGPLKLMISGLFYVPYDILGSDRDLGYAVLLVAVDQKNSQTYSGKMHRFGFRGPRPPVQKNNDNPKPDVEGNFNIDLVQNLSLPIANATYTVYATLSKYKSNVLTVQTLVE